MLDLKLSQLILDFKPSPSYYDLKTKCVILDVKLSPLY